MGDYQNSALLEALNMTSKVDEVKVFSDSFKSLASQIDRHNCGYECTMHGGSKTYSQAVNFDSKSGEMNISSPKISKINEFNFIHEKTTLENKTYSSNSQKSDFFYEKSGSLSNSFRSIADIITPQNKQKNLEMKVDFNQFKNDEKTAEVYRKETSTFGSKEYSSKDEVDWYSSVSKFYENKEKEPENQKEEANKEPKSLEENKNDKRSGSEKRSEDDEPRKSDEFGERQDSGGNRGNDESKQSFISSAAGSSTGVLQSADSKGKSDDSGSGGEGNKRRAGKTGSVSCSAGEKLRDNS